MKTVDLEKKKQLARDLVKSGQFEKGLKLYATLVQHIPLLEGEYGCAAVHAGDFHLADRIWTKFRERERKNAKVLFWLAGQYGTIGMYARCRELLREATRIEPRDLELQTNLAAVLGRSSKDGETRQVVAKCLELDPRSEQARYLSAHLDRLENKLGEAERQIRDLINSGLKLPEVRCACHTELAYILDRTERFDEAAGQREERRKHALELFHLKQMRNVTAEQLEIGVRRVRSMPKNILTTWSRAFPASVRTAVAPVALLTGAARSGTTLLEKIMDAHPAVSACDEPQAFAKVMPQIDIAATDVPVQKLNALRQLYANNLTTVLDPEAHGKTLLDKNPSKTLWLPFLLRVLPELRVLIALRDPRDVLVSLYFQDNSRTNHLTFEQLTPHYTAVMEAWQAIREWEGFDWMETRYEDFVADLEKEGRRITAFLGLDWNENQARYYERNREKATLSNNYSDVTKPIYTRAVGRWRNYEKQLAPILPALDPYCRKYGYT